MLHCAYADDYGVDFALFIKYSDLNGPEWARVSKNPKQSITARTEFHIRVEVVWIRIHPLEKSNPDPTLATNLNSNLTKKTYWNEITVLIL